MTAKLLHFRGGCHLRVKGKGTEDRGRRSPGGPWGLGACVPGTAAPQTRKARHMVG